MHRTGYTLIIPTYNEKANIVALILEIEKNLRQASIPDFEILVMDDDSPDGTAETVNALGDPQARAVNRRGRPRGLSAAVIDGFEEARGQIVGVMDSDFSHPASVIPAMIAALREGYNLVIGSRYVPGGGTDRWPLKRVIGSRAACWMARPVTAVKDATSGFFFLKKSILEGVPLDALGFKIGLEVFVKARHENKIKEVPFVFTARREGSSKLSPYVMSCYLRQLARLFRYRIFGGGR